MFASLILLSAAGTATSLGEREIIRRNYLPM